MATIAFVHGAYHSGAHFDLVAASLRDHGHTAVAPDLPVTDPRAGAREYAATVAEALLNADEDVVIVGHSMGGLTAPVVASFRPVRAIVFVAALIPEAGRSFDDVTWHDHSVSAPYSAQTAPYASEDGSASTGPARAAEVFFHDASWPRKQWAVSLLRPQQWRILQEPCPLDAMPTVEAHAIVCRDDRVVSPEWTARSAKERFAAEAMWMDGGHCPMVSRPDELAAALLSLL